MRPHTGLSHPTRPGNRHYGACVAIKGLPGYALELRSAQLASVKGVKTGLLGGVHRGTLLGENRNRHNPILWYAGPCQGGPFRPVVSPPSPLLLEEKS